MICVEPFGIELTFERDYRSDGPQCAIEECHRICNVPDATKHHADAAGHKEVPHPALFMELSRQPTHVSLQLSVAG